MRTTVTTVCADGGHVAVIFGSVHCEKKSHREIGHLHLTTPPRPLMSMLGAQSRVPRAAKKSPIPATCTDPYCKMPTLRCGGGGAVAEAVTFRMGLFSQCTEWKSCCLVWTQSLHRHRLRNEYMLRRGRKPGRRRRSQRVHPTRQPTKPPSSRPGCQPGNRRGSQNGSKAASQ